MYLVCILWVFFFKQKTAYEMRISDWSSDVCSSDLARPGHLHPRALHHRRGRLPPRGQRRMPPEESRRDGAPLPRLSGSARQHPRDRQALPLLAGGAAPRLPGGTDDGGPHAAGGTGTPHLVGAQRRYPDGVTESVRKTLRHELDLIGQLDYAPFFLTVEDVVRFARTQGILCQGRGSAANSAVCFCLGITEDRKSTRLNSSH